MTQSSPQERLAELGQELPDTPAPAGSYVPAVRVGDLVFTAGQLPFEGGQVTVTGLVGADVTTEQAAVAARTAAMNALAAAAGVAGGVDAVGQIVKVVVFVASAPGFTDQPLVANGASELFGQIFGEAGIHARSAVGVVALPKNAAVEVELVASVRATPTIHPL